VEPFPKAQSFFLHNLYSPLLLSDSKVSDPWMYFSHIPNLNLHRTFSGTKWGGLPFRQAWARLAINPTIVSPGYVETSFGFK
jgi:hypothetical protein